MENLSDVVALLQRAQELAAAGGHKNLLQPGLIKELIIGAELGHEVHTTKHDADAWKKDNPDEKYEYLTTAGGGFQIDRLFKTPPAKRAKSLERISRNAKVYCATFFDENPFKVTEIYEVETDTFRAEVERQLDAGKNDIGHANVSLEWVKTNGRRVRP